MYFTSADTDTFPVGRHPLPRTIRQYVPSGLPYYTVPYNWKVSLIGLLPKLNEFNAILVIVDGFSKMIILIATTTELTSVKTAEIYRDYVWSKHGLPRKVISDRGPQFIAQFMLDLHKLVSIQANPSTAYHPQTDDQTERMNQEIEQYRHLFINHRQNNWQNWLTCTEFSYNDKVHTSTGFSPFFMNYGHHPNKGTSTRKEVKSQSAIEFAEEMSKVWEETECALRLAAEQMKKFYDRKRGDSHEYNPGDKVWLEGQNIPADRPSKKVDDKRYSPFKVIKKVGKAAYKLDLPHTWRAIWPIFNKIFLTPYISPSSSQQKNTRPVPDIIDNYEEYEVEEIMNSQLKWGRLRYLVRWKGWPEHHHWTWEPPKNLTHTDEAIDEYHKKNPAAPWPMDLSLLYFVKMPSLTVEGHTYDVPAMPTGIYALDAWTSNFVD